MRKVHRYERALILDYTEDKEDGFITVELAATRPGVMPYFDHETGEIVNELKPPDEIFSEDTMNSLKGVPITDRHPPVMVNSKNWFDFTKGTTHLDAREEDGLLVVSETIFDDELIAYVQSGKKEQVSIGFDCDLVEEEGEFDGEKYDKIQRNIRINHVAHVEQGRAGEKVKARLDSLPKDGRIAYSLGDVSKNDGEIPPNPSDYGTTESSWNDITSDLPSLSEMSEEEIEETMSLYAWAASNDPDEITNKATDLKLPHHETNGDVNWNGVVAAMAVVNGAQGGVDIPQSDRRDVYNHLVNHYRADFDEEPPDYEDEKEKEDEKSMEGMKKIDLKAAFDDIEGLIIDGDYESPEIWVDEDKDFDFGESIEIEREEKEDEVELEEVEIGDETIKVVKEDAERLKNELDSMEGKLDSKETEIEKLEGRVDELEDKDVEKIVQDRLDLIDKIRNYVPDYDASGKGTIEIKTDLVQKLDEDFDPEGKSYEYIAARFDGAVKTLEKMKSDSYGSNNLFTKRKKKDNNDKLEEKRAKRKNLKK